MKKIEFKIMLSIMLFTIFIVLLQRYQLSENIVHQFEDSKKSKNRLLINTISPIVSLNISLGLKKSYNSYLNKIIQDNPDLEAVILKDVQQNPLFIYIKKEIKELNYSQYNFLEKKIFDSLTGEEIATMQLNFSNDDYETMMAKSLDITINIFFISFILLTLFLFLIKKEFMTLQELTQNVLNYDPQKNNFPLREPQGEDEVSLIHKAIISMVNKINLYSQELDSINANLEVIITSRTKELKEQKLKAEEAVHVKSNFLANMSHEIRTPLNAIIGTLHLVKSTNLNKIQEKYLQKIYKVSHNLLIIINDILDFSKLEAGKLKIENLHFNIDPMLDNLLYIFEDKISEKNLHFSIKKICTHSIFQGDSFRIEQVLINFISNAIKFTSKGDIELQIECFDKNIVRFSVKDSGIGIAKKQQKVLFKPFIQADSSTTRKYGGTGLGLSISKQIIEQMNGKVWIQSKLNHGSTFIFEITLLKGKRENNKINKNLYKQKISNLYCENIEYNTSTSLLPQETIDTLFHALKEASKRNLPKVCEPLIQELCHAKLSHDDYKKIKQIIMLFQHYKFKEIHSLLEEK